ncbi:MAG: HisA/HisF-related TIM barrel protein [Sphaerochaetaceae bacterium]
MERVVKRIIPCFDINRGKLVKGINFENLREAGDVRHLARRYVQEGADELTLLDIKSTPQERQQFLTLVKEIRKMVEVPLLIGGGVNSVEVARELFDIGASKITVGSMAVRKPQLLEELANAFGSSRIVCAIDAKEGEVMIGGGREKTGIAVLDWVREVEKRGAGEILLTSMDKDGTREGFDNHLTKACKGATSLKIIASGGGGTMEHFAQILTFGEADAALAASVFHFRTITIAELKIFLDNRGIPVRLKY